jgi:heat shock protein HslJ
VINVPPTVQTPDGQGWVSAAFVDASNVENVPVVPAPSLEANLVGTNWLWTSLTNPAGLTTISDPSRYSILFNADGTANIKADCNNVGATYTIESSNIGINLGPATLAACPEDSQDQQFLAGLENARIYFFEGGDLFMDLFADAGTMRFTAGSSAPPPDPAVPSDPDSISGGADGILFQLVSYGPAGAEQPVLEGTQITATFSDAEVAGSAGCNNYVGTLTQVNDYFTVGPIVTTQQVCSDPAGIMEQEQAYLTALEGTAGYRWQSQPVNGTTVITAGQLFYTLSDGTEGVLNFIAPG